MPELGRHAAATAIEPAVKVHAHTHAMFDCDDAKTVNASAFAEPTLGERHQIDVVLHDYRDAQTLHH